MPIVNIKESVQLEFGTGDIDVAHGAIPGEKWLGVVCYFQRETPNEIGARGDLKPMSKVPLEETPVRMVFEKVESIDVVIRALEKAKEHMIAGKIVVDE